MKKQRIILILLVTFVFFAFAGYKFSPKKDSVADENANFSPPDIIQPVQAAQANAENAKQKNDSEKSGYKIKDYKGKLAVFESGEKKPFRVTDIDIKDLPQEDQKQLEKGIEASDSGHLQALLEDYLS